MSRQHRDALRMPGTGRDALTTAGRQVEAVGVPLLPEVRSLTYRRTSLIKLPTVSSRSERYT